MSGLGLLRFACGLPHRYLVPEEFLPLRDSESIYWKRIAQIKCARPPFRNEGPVSSVFPHLWGLDGTVWEPLIRS